MSDQSSSGVPRSCAPSVGEGASEEASLVLERIRRAESICVGHGHRLSLVRG